MQRKIIQVEEKVPLSQWVPLSFQHLFAMFGASVLVPILFHIDPAVVLLMNGVGTLLFILITKGKAPAFLGSSFAFLAPVFAVFSSGGSYRMALGGFVVVGLTFCAVALIVKFFGVKWINIVMPPAAMGPVVALIGLELAGVAANMGGLILDNPKVDQGVMDLNSTYANYFSFNYKYVTVFLITLGVAVFGSILFRKFFAVIPILVAVVAGYVAAVCFGIVDFSAVVKAHWFSLPQFQTPIFKPSVIWIILPAALVVISEHIGHQLVTSKIVGRDLIKDPGLHRTLLSDGISTALSGLVGSVPTTTYGENIGVMAITRVYSVWVIGGAAAISIVIAFIGKIAAFIQTIPPSVIGGISFLLYGMIAASGIRLMVESKIDYSRSRNLVLTSVIFVVGLSGVFIPINSIQFKGMVLATVVGMILSLIFYVLDKLKLTNDIEVEEPVTDK